MIEIEWTLKGTSGPIDDHTLKVHIVWSRCSYCRLLFLMFL